MKVYVLQSLKDGRLYVGMSENVELRLKQHNKGMTTSTKFYKPWKLLFIEEYSTRVEAREREKYLKGGSGKEYIKNWLRSSTEYLPAGRQGASEESDEI
jgi:putative endonuclease